jgi:kinesin family protein C1
MRKSKVDKSSGAVVLNKRAQRSLVVPKTPSHIPISKRAEATLATPATPSRSAKNSSNKTQFLTKDSNIPAFTAWDVHGRLEDMEAMYSELKKTLTGTAVERNGLEEAIAQYKARCMCWPL